ncbi:MAG: hypothetical protein PUD93_11175 [Lachnospiraceae bacterium]|nr:hypothetical protein [Lachnospiraceae bacterium]
MEYIVFAGAMVLFLLVIMGKGYWDEKKSEKKFINDLQQKYGVLPERKYRADELDAHISMYYKKHQTDGQLDDITWNDLNMDEIYQKMNYSHSAAGDEYLYYCLRTPVKDAGELEAFEKKIQYFMQNEKERVGLQIQFAKLGRMSKYSLYEYLEYLEHLGERKSIKYYLAVLLVIISIIAMFFSVQFGICMLLIVLCRNMIGYYKEQKQIEPYITSFRYIFRLLSVTEQIGKLPVAEIEEERKRLLECNKAMDGFKRNSFLLMSGQRGGAGITSSNLLEVIVDYLRMMFYLDLIKFNQMLEQVRNHVNEIDEMVTIIGKLETAVVIGEYRAGKKNGYCVPEFVASKESRICLELQQMYHPLLREPVKNDVKVNKGILITGSNASGKSTFLRGVAVNAVLAQTIHTCTADSYRGNIFRIYSSMSLKDDLESGDSYYMAEVKSIRRILQSVEQAKEKGEKVLCFVDEVLRGTNTVERIAASTQILKALAGKNVICFAATHDLELTKLLNDFYENYHFEENIVEDDIFFPYRLQEGPAVSRNAIALLKVLGYQENLVKDAESMAQNFLQSGKWSKDAVCAAIGNEI